MISTTGFVLIAFLIIILAIALFYFGVAYKYYQTLTVFSYSRGANIDTGPNIDPSTNKTSGKGSVTMTCDPDRTICLVRADAICTGGSINNGEWEHTEPISNGEDPDNPYGDFAVGNTVPLTDDISKVANGQQSYTYTFDGTKYNFNGATCPLTYDPTSGVGTRPQLVATYTCVPNGQPCQSVKKKIKPIKSNGDEGNKYNEMGNTFVDNIGNFNMRQQPPEIYMGSRDYVRW